MADFLRRQAGAISVLIVILILSVFLSACKKNDPEPAPSFAFQTVSGFVISDAGEKLLATDAGLCSLDVSNGLYVAIENQLENEPLNDLVYSFTSPERELWLASDKGGYNQTADYVHNQANSALQNDQVSDIGFNHEHYAFFASTEGLSLLNGEQWSNYAGLDDFFLYHQISDIGSASNGYTYVTTYGGGIERFKADIDGISGATIMDTDWTQMESNYVHSVYIDDTTQVYGTNLGVAFHFSEYTKWDWEVYTTADGLVNDTVLSVVRDLSGNWWMGTANGVSMFDDLAWVSYSPDDYKMAGKQASFLALDTDGAVWMASDEGLSRYSEGSWTAYPVP